MRSCGECEACCVTRKVEEIQKPAGQPCPHQTGRGCALQGQPSRPGSCVSFACLWLDGWGALADQPRLSGVVLTFPNPFLGRAVYHAHEAQPGALQHPLLRERLAEIARDVTLIETTLGQTQIVRSPLEIVQHLAHTARRTLLLHADLH